MQEIAIVGLGSLSSLGKTKQDIWSKYQNKKPYLSFKETVFMASLSEESSVAISDLRKENANYKKLDLSVLYAILSSRQAVQEAGWQKGDNFGINIGSSRGATSLFEEYHESFLKNNRSETISSPTTTLGNISSWVANDLQTNGPEISHSITCSTALHSLLNGVAWLQSGLCSKFLVGGTEAALTPFTISQMQALKVYSKEKENVEYPCLALDVSKTRNTMVLGEGAAMICLEKGKTARALAYIKSIGYATEILTHHVSISTSAICFQKSMKMALQNIDNTDIDAIVMHAPGTIKGDQSELNAIEKVFGKQTPLLTTNKWKIGHTFGASGMLSVEFAILMLQNNEFIASPFYPMKQERPLRKIMVNAVGFGGNAVSVVIGI